MLACVNTLNQGVIKIPSKEIRRVIQAGNAVAVVIPAHWARYYNLTKGSKIEIVTNGSMTVTPILEDKTES